MTHWLLTAEADKIQHLVFRSSHLREVVGGSQLLTRFCTEVTPRLLQDEPFCGRTEDIIVADGGSFTINFLYDTAERAQRFGQELAQLYRATTGSTMTVAPPEPWSGQPADFAAANKRAREALALAKRQGRSAEASDHWPYTAFCASCGIGLAYTHESLHERERANYLCISCRCKADEPPVLRDRWKRTVVPGMGRSFDLPTDWDKASEGWDSRQYVAYMIADGNGMGKVFGNCASMAQLNRLSKGLTEVLQKSLDEPTQLLMARAPGFRQWEIPMVPLILGGDDVFVRMPAPYALDFARRFCERYEELIRELLSDLKLSVEEQPTIATAIVVCKSKYPHTLAHQHGEKLLQEAKRLAKVTAQAHPGHAHSVVNFDLILGHRIAGAGQSTGKEYRSSLRPYWVSADPPPKVGLPIDRLLKARLDLRDLPKRRLAQLRELFESDQLPTELPTEKANNLGRWQARLEQTNARVARSEEIAKRLRAAEADLGGASQGNWYDVERPGPKDSFYYAHGLPDLLQMWDFCYDLARDRRDYEPEE